MLEFMMPKAFLGIDVSTTGSTVIAIDEHGKILATHSCLHTLSTPHALWSEQNSEEWWSATIHAISDVLISVPSDQIAAIGLSGQMLGLIALDGSGNPLRPAILWNDQRSGEQSTLITESVAADRLHTLMGSIMIPGLVAPKLLWLRQYEPEIYRQIKHVILPKDYVR